MASTLLFDKGKKSYRIFRMLPKIFIALIILIILILSILQKYDAPIWLIGLIAAFFCFAIYSISIYQFVLVMRFSKLAGAHTNIKTFGYILLLLITIPGVFMMDDAGKRIAYQLEWDIPPYMK